MTTEERLTKVETEVEHIDETLKDIQLNVTNHLPSKIEQLGKDLNRYKLSQSKWMIGLLTTVVISLILLVVNICMGLIS